MVIKSRIVGNDWDLPAVTPVIQDFTLGSRLRRDDRMSPRALNSEGGNGGGGGGGRLACQSVRGQMKERGEGYSGIWLQ